MGRGGTDLLWSSGFDLYELHLNASAAKLPTLRSSDALNLEEVLLGCSLYSSSCTPTLDYQGYRDKPYGQLVLVSLMHYCTSTPSLSTSWSRTTLQGAQGSGKSHLKASFPLRCFQRLSLPNLATRQCHWRDNRYTRGSSTPVLSY